MPWLASATLYSGAMPRPTRKDDWGFPRWRPYGAGRDAQPVRMCDRHGCDRPGDCPAPKAPNSPERWYFCTEHAGEYNRNWDYFQGLSPEEAAAREARESADAKGFASARHYGWGGAGDGSRSADEMRALELFDLAVDADFEAIKRAWRALAKETHPDVAPGDAVAADRFKAGQAAFDVLRAAEDRRQPAATRA